jgi:hypothetical protein
LQARSLTGLAIPRTRLVLRAWGCATFILPQIPDP